MGQRQRRQAVAQGLAPAGPDDRVQAERSSTDITEDEAALGWAMLIEAIIPGGDSDDGGDSEDGDGAPTGTTTDGSGALRRGRRRRHDHASAQLLLVLRDAADPTRSPLAGGQAL
jgi:hypothetical protein